MVANAGKWTDAAGLLVAIGGEVGLHRGQLLKALHVGGHLGEGGKAVGADKLPVPVKVLVGHEVHVAELVCDQPLLLADPFLKVAQRGDESVEDFFHLRLKSGLILVRFVVDGDDQIVASVSDRPLDHVLQRLVLGVVSHQAVLPGKVFQNGDALVRTMIRN